MRRRRLKRLRRLAVRIKWAEVKRYAEAGARYIVEQERAKIRR